MDLEDISNAVRRATKEGYWREGIGWCVYSRYSVIKREHESRHYIIPEPDDNPPPGFEPIDLWRDGNRYWCRRYNPLKEPRLLLSFVRCCEETDFDSGEAVLRWVKTWGLLGTEDVPWTDGEPLEGIQGRMRWVRHLFTLYEDVCNSYSRGNYDALRRRFRCVETTLTAGDGSRRDIFRCFYVTKEGRELDAGFSSDSDLQGLPGEALAALTMMCIADHLVPAGWESQPYGLGTINLSWSRVIPDPESPAGWRVQPAFTWHTLYGVILLHLWWLITEPKPVRRCLAPGCGQPFLVTKSDKRYCSGACRKRAFDARRPRKDHALAQPPGA